MLALNKVKRFYLAGFKEGSENRNCVVAVEQTLELRHGITPDILIEPEEG